MPKINVYLPDDLADAVKEMGVPVSAICQRALEASVRRVTAVRQATLGQVPLDDPAGRMAHFTAKSRAAVGLAVRSARASGSDTVGTEHLLAGLLADDTNLAMVVLTSMEIEPAAIGQALAAAGVTAAAAEAAATSAAPADPDPGTGPGAGAGASGGALRFSGPAANALELAVTEAISLGHNYVGCEHLLLGLASETEGTGGAVLRDLGADARPVRRAVTAALAGYTAISASKQARAQVAGQPGQSGQASQPGQPGAGQMLAMLREAVRREMQPFTERLERLEERLGPEGDQP
ncbi:MAG TPA: Clp protease N-terminal domain-containing protein [Streptosporangiaceae bacterium]